MRVLTGLILTVLLFCSFVAFAEDGKVNFSGEWSFNNEKSQLPNIPDMGGGPDEQGTQNRGGRAPRMTPKELIINQTENRLSIQRVLEGRDGNDFTITENFTLDGKERPASSPFGGARKVTAKWSEEGKSITIISTIVFERDDNQMQMSSAEIWKLSEDGKSLSIESVSQAPFGNIEATYVYNKK